MALTELSKWFLATTRRIHRNQLYEWMRRVTSSLNGLDGQTAWFVSEAGSVTNDGKTAATPIPEKERQRRWGLITQITADTTVTYLDVPAVPTNFNCANTETAANLTITASSTIAFSGTITAVQVLNRATQTPWAITAVGLGAAHVGKIVQIPTGARAGAYARILADLGGGKVLISPFGTVNLANFQAFSTVTPQVNDPIQVLTFLTIPVGTWIFNQGNQRFLGDGTSTNLVKLDLIKIDGNFDQGSINSSGWNFVTLRSIMANMGLAGPYGGFMFCGGGVDQPFLTYGPIWFCFGIGAISGWLPMASGAILDQDSTFVCPGAFGSALNIGTSSFASGAALVIGVVGIFNTAQADSACIVAENSTLVSRNGNGFGDLLYGTGNAGHGAKVFSRGGIIYTTKPTINGGLGAGRELLAGGVDTVWGAVPIAAMPANGATVQVRA